ncbi:MAG: diacylglycerol/lipid kinase family protein [Candidatus Sericytochromatia bacterium]
MSDPEAHAMVPERSQAVRRIVLVYNPASCAWLSHAQPEDTERYLREQLDPLDLAYDLVPFDGDTLAALPAQLKALHSEAIWVAGGDGSVLALAPIAKQLDLPLGVIPAGTMNLLARDLGMSLDLPTALRQLASAETVPIDVADVNGYPFLCISNLGVSTRYTQLREDMRHQSGWVRWPSLTWHMLQTLFNYPLLHLRIVANGQSWRVKSRAVSITNNPLCDNGGLVPSREVLDSGKLGIYVTQETAIWSLPRLMAKLMLGNWQHDPEMLAIHTEEAMIHFSRRRKRKIKVMSDGEIFTHRTPLHYRIRAKHLPMLRPVVAASHPEAEA